MKYFETLPKAIKTDIYGVKTVFTNIMSRANMVNEKLSSPLLFYTYDIQEGDTPEIIAEKYYGDAYRYWIILLSNNIMDPQWEWPILNNAFSAYINSKYSDVDPYSDAHHYEKVITKYESGTQTTTVDIIQIDEAEYDSLVESSNTYNFNTGNCTVTTTKRAISFFQYEMDLNESRRTIKLLKKELVTQFESELITLMNRK